MFSKDEFFTGILIDRIKPDFYYPVSLFNHNFKDGMREENNMPAM